jgi:hypothetical protein
MPYFFNALKYLSCNAATRESFPRRFTNEVEARRRRHNGYVMTEIEKTTKKITGFICCYSTTNTENYLPAINLHC